MHQSIHCHFREGSISKRIDNASRTNERKRSNTDMEKPFWCLQTVIDKGDQVRVNKDTTREEEIKEIKRMWYSGNPSRYEDSWNIRFLKKRRPYIFRYTEVNL